MGSRCQLVNPCSTSPCGANGICYAVLQINSLSNKEEASYICRCFDSYIGLNCQTSKNSI